MAGDVVYNQCRIYVGDTTRRAGGELGRGAGPAGGAESDDGCCRTQEDWRASSPSTIQDTKRYLQDFDRLQKTAKSDKELFDQMMELYPDWVANQSWLMFGFPQP